MLQVVLTGLSTGAIYGLVGMGFAVVFYVTRVINFATGPVVDGGDHGYGRPVGRALAGRSGRRRGPADVDNRRSRDLFPGGSPRPALQPFELRLARQHARCRDHPGVGGRLDLGHVIAVVPAVAQRQGTSTSSARP